jgi:MFS family permease
MLRYSVLLQLCLLAAIAYVQRAAMSVPALEIAEDLRFASVARDMGWVQSAWYLGYALMQLPSGWLADRWGSRRAVVVFCLSWSLMTLAAGFATGFASLLTLWGLMGAAQAGVFPAAAKAIGQIFPDSERARASGILAGGMSIGGAMAPLITAAGLQLWLPVAELTEVLRWRWLLWSFALPGVLWCGLFLVLTPARQLPVSREKLAGRTAVDYRLMLRSQPLLLLCLQQFFRAMGMVFLLTWFPVFLQQTRGVSTLESGYLASYAGLGSVLGSFSGGFVSDWLLRRTGRRRLSRQGLAVAGMSSCAVLIVLSYFASSTSVSIALIAAGVFCATFGGVSGYTVAIEFGGGHVATVFSTMNMCGNFGATLFPITAGWLVARTDNWDLILFLFAGIMAVDAVCWALLNPSGTLFGDSAGGEFEQSVAAAAESLSGGDRKS